MLASSKCFECKKLTVGILLSSKTLILIIFHKVAADDEDDNDGENHFINSPLIVVLLPVESMHLKIFFPQYF